MVTLKDPIYAFNTRREGLHLFAKQNEMFGLRCNLCISFSSLHSFDSISAMRKTKISSCTLPMCHDESSIPGDGAPFVPVLLLHSV